MTYTPKVSDTLVRACDTCVHYLGAGRCTAFADQIPADIIGGRDMHRDQVDGDGGIVYEKSDAIKSSNPRT